MLAWQHLGTALWKVIKDENISSCESLSVAPCSSRGYVEEQLPFKEYGNEIEEGHYAVRVVVDREPITSQFHSEIQEVIAKGEAWPLSDTPKSFDYYKGLHDLFSEFSYPELAVLNREEAAEFLRSIDRELFEACSYLDINKIRFVLHRGANPNALKCEYIDTPLKELVWAVVNNQGAIQEPDQKDWYRGKYPVVQLTTQNKTAMVELLINYGAHPDVHWFEENTPLAIAACNDEEEIVSTLLKYGSDPSIPSFFDSGITNWPSAWEYATDECQDRTEEEWQAHKRIVTMLETLCPSPYYVHNNTPEQHQESQPVAETITDNDIYAVIQRQALEYQLARELTASEREYIESSEHSALAQNCYYLALAYNSHEPRWILEHCSPVVQYTSQSVFKSLCGIKEYREYLTGKIRTLSEVTASNQARFELGYSPHGKPCVIGYQRQGEFSCGLGARLLWMSIDLDEQDRIESICAVTCAPPASEAQGTDIFPGISDEQIRSELSCKPQKIPTQVELVFKLFVLDPLSELDITMINETKSVVATLAHAQIIVKSTGSSKWEDVEERSKYHIVSLPNLVVEHAGNLVMQLQGLYLAPQIRERLATYVFLE